MLSLSLRPVVAGFGLGFDICDLGLFIQAFALFLALLTLQD